jgi:pantoate--beta-alanine ligase
MSAPILIERIAGLREALAGFRRSGAVVGLVPTMGGLHAGHARLMEEARRGADVVVVSIFVNPIQFNQREDFEHYPRDLGRDMALCGEAGADIVFAPPAAEMYPEPSLTFVEVEELTRHLCGRFRPGHFRGVATVVAKLFQIVQPDRAWFGEKDAQQLAVIRRMVRDLNIPVEIVEVATVREPDGLALSSRNRHLGPRERGVAPALYRALRAGAEAFGTGAAPADVLGRVRAELECHPEIRIEYVELVDPGRMQPIERADAPARLAAAVWLGSTRLIDNVLCLPPAAAR